jgi:hypothetical protein
MTNSTNSSYAAADTAPADAESQIDKAAPVLLAGADTITASAVQQLTQVQQARVSRLTRTANVAVAQYGQNSAQAVKAQTSVAATKTAAASLAVAGQRISTPAPTVAADGWALQGRVYDSNLNPLAGYSVFLVDSQKNYLSVFGFAYTDSTGYFLINYAPASTPSGTASPDAASMFPEVADTSGNPVYLSSTAFAPVEGKATYQTITLPAGGTELGDPPAAVRAVALPPEKKGWRPPGQ